MSETAIVINDLPQQSMGRAYLTTVGPWLPPQRPTRMRSFDPHPVVGTPSTFKSITRVQIARSIFNLLVMFLQFFF